MLQQKKVWFSKSRVETFSDGVFAIIITILVLEIHVLVIQHHDNIGELWTALLELFSKFISWIISFFMVCVIWVNRHRIFKSIEHLSPKIFWLNSWLLLWCAFIPFPTALVGDYLNNSLALTIFGFVLGLMGSAFVLMRLVILKEHLMNEKFDKALFKKSTKNTIVFGVMLY